MSHALLPCPFCGHDSPEFERTGDGRRSCIVICGYCGCRHESGDEGEHNGSSWNERPKPDTTLADEVASVLVQLDKIEDTWDDEAAFLRCRERLRAALKQAKGDS